MTTLDLDAAAAMLCMSPDALMRKARAGIVPGAKPGRRWAFIRDDILPFVRQPAPQREPRSSRTSYHSARRYAALLQRTPAWSSPYDINCVYRECERISIRTGIKHQVDHDMPLLGRLVSGLHVAENLRIVPASHNMRKGNRWNNHDSVAVKARTEDERLEELRKYVEHNRGRKRRPK